MFKAILEKMNVEDGTPKSEGEQPGGDAAAASAGTPEGAPPDVARMEAEIIEALKTIYDPEIPVNIYELGLIYEIKIAPDAMVDVKMTLTSPACPVAGSLPGEVEQKVKTVAGVKDAKIELVWEPSWNMTMMTEAARLELNMM